MQSCLIKKCTYKNCEGLPFKEIDNFSFGLKWFFKAEWASNPVVLHTFEGLV